MNNTYNIHKKINCIFPFFKSKFLCNKGIHNFEYNSKKIELKPTIIKEDGITEIYRNTKYITYIKCYCCGLERYKD